MDSPWAEATLNYKNYKYFMTKDEDSGKGLIPYLFCNSQSQFPSRHKNTRKETNTKQHHTNENWLLKQKCVTGKNVKVMNVFLGMYICLESKMTKKKIKKGKKKKRKLFCQWMDILTYLNKMITSQAGNSLGWKRTLCNQCSCARLEKWMIMETRELMDLPVRSLWLSKWEASYNGRGRKQNHFDN